MTSTCVLNHAHSTHTHSHTLSCQSFRENKSDCSSVWMHFFFFFFFFLLNKDSNTRLVWTVGIYGRSCGVSQPACSWLTVMCSHLEGVLLYTWKINIYTSSVVSESIDELKKNLVQKSFEHIPGILNTSVMHWAPFLRDALWMNG